ncbi:ubiquinone anaerobic biosynthesis accessory factor UbiT [Pollutimonas harenae]|uniref:Ubiquinone biosynthesis accessory factor UbiT n=1 Tax=Pollutimonas harenae TaxID=657015 RepID=A0A853H4A9_9BURK|nr:SCP2 sterol-binding domain-containing protein [Pollutimonas harenae]NYT86749.1 SCP2 sterol-binding domain-containing protein [Pollutimonas harenae]TEA71397.1 sterol-binding protein [Pollutimonas harenae]
MNSGNHSVPAPLSKLLAHLPAYPGSVLFAAGLNLALAQHLPVDTLHMLENRILRIQARDAAIAFDFVWSKGKFSAVAPGGDVALTIAAPLYDFYLLIQRKEDPDTLFFSRRLSMEGDTELGLLVKNTLDALDMSLFTPEQFLPGKMLGRLLPRVASKPGGF